jgi:hypothetical protein
MQLVYARSHCASSYVYTCWLLLLSSALIANKPITQAVLEQHILHALITYSSVNNA